MKRWIQIIASALVFGLIAGGVMVGLNVAATNSGLVAQGVGLWIGVQALINIGVAIGVFPTKGLTLPLVSYGGSSIVVTLCALGLLLRVDYENRLLMRGKRRR